MIICIANKNVATYFRREKIIFAQSNLQKGKDMLVVDGIGPVNDLPKGTIEKIFAVSPDLKEHEIAYITISDLVVL
jgi:hypothetical protein